MIGIFTLIIKIFFCLLIFLAVILIIPVKYLLDIQIGGKNKIYFCLSYLYGIIKFEYSNGEKNKFKISGINMIKGKRQKSNTNTQNNNDSVKKISDKISTLYKKNTADKNSFKFNDIKPLLSPTLEFIKDVVEKVRPNLIEINGQIGFEDPANTGYVCAIINMAAPILNIKQNIDYNFQNKMLDINLILRGKTRALLFIFIMIKYLRNEHVFSFLKNNFISREVY